MIVPSLASTWKRTFGPRTSTSRRPRRRAAFRPERLESRTVLSTYTLPLVDGTLLDPAKYSIYVDGFSTGSGLTLQPGSSPGTLAFAAHGDTVPSFQVGSGQGEYGTIQIDTTQPVDGGRIYLFIVPSGQAPPSFPFGTQPANPPAYPYVYQYLELTQPSGGGRPTIDVPTVDGFAFPVTLTLNDGLGQVGQPLSGASGTRAAVISQFQTFASASGRTMYKPLQLTASAKAAGQSEGLLNPYTYLIEPAGGNPLPANAASPLNGVFDRALGTLFARSGWSLKGTDSNVYTATAGTYQYGSLVNPVTGKPVMLRGLRFQGGGNTLKVFSPVGVNVFLGANGKPITAATTTALNKITLTNAPLPGVLKPGMYVFGQYFDQAAGLATNFVTSLARDKSGKVVVTLKNPLPFAVTGDQLVFSQLPYTGTMKLTRGAMVFGGAGLFADAVQQGVTGAQIAVLGNLENQIVSALNRGVAVVPGTTGAPGPMTPSTDGSTTRYWGTESNWYPPGQPQNLFSLFLHTATVGGSPIFVRPAKPAVAKTGAPMAMAYGFSFDENPGPVPPAPTGQAQVPAKFDPVPDGTTTITVTLGAWTSGA
ncbi:hypothetical protein [Paludisphaera mucosa]|uniref:Beta-1,3-glucanase N-terminal domain-containing protein n=1 Tax=Paludisphaera mucosa TaxID=3030827 RepID=A0ABT6F3U3_9BACT|nr:hypothetical protein [Paludisphaera mucosa]MDG3002189.1 hypothetical protein [Paludisphaera mucosa]